MQRRSFAVPYSFVEVGTSCAQLRRLSTSRFGHSCSTWCTVCSAPHSQRAEGEIPMRFRCDRRPHAVACSEPENRGLVASFQVVYWVMFWIVVSCGSPPFRFPFVFQPKMKSVGSIEFERRTFVCIKLK